MSARPYRAPRRFRPRTRYGRRQGSPAGAFAGIAIGIVLASGVTAKAVKAVTAHHAGHAAKAPASPARAAVPAAGEAGFFTAVLADLGAPAAAANLSSLAAWAAHEGCWGCVGAWNPLDTTLPEPGSWAFNTFGGGLHVQSYPSAAEGARATAATIGGYPLIGSALRSGTGVCGGGFAGEFLSWSGDGYSEVC